MIKQIACRVWRLKTNGRNARHKDKIKNAENPVWKTFLRQIFRSLFSPVHFTAGKDGAADGFSLR